MSRCRLEYYASHSSICQVRGVVGGPVSIKNIQLSLLEWWHRVKDRCVEACTSSSSADCEVNSTVRPHDAAAGVRGRGGRAAPR
jgi:hypothetical protein